MSLKVGADNLQGIMHVQSSPSLVGTSLSVAQSQIESPKTEATPMSETKK